MYFIIVFGIIFHFIQISGLYAECRANGETPTCSCLPNYFGSPPNCRPECVVNTDCPSDKSCIAEKCRNPCEGSCGEYFYC